MKYNALYIKNMNRPISSYLTSVLSFQILLKYMEFPVRPFPEIMMNWFKGERETEIAEE